MSQQIFTVGNTVSFYQCILFNEIRQVGKRNYGCEIPSQPTCYPEIVSLIASIDCNAIR